MGYIYLPYISFKYHIYIYIYIYKEYMSVCVCVCIQAGYDKRSILKQSLTGLNS